MITVFFDFDIDKQIDPRHTRAWAQFAARINAGQWNYREMIIEQLKADNHRIHIAEDSSLRQEEIILEAQAEAAYKAGEYDECDRLQSRLAEIEQKLEEKNYQNKVMKVEASNIRAENRLNHAVKVSQTPTPDKQRYEKLKEQRAKTPDELAEELKFNIVDTYLTEDVTPELVVKHQDGWNSKIRTDYYLKNPEKVIERDRKHLETAIENGDGITTLQDLKFLTAKIELMLLLRIPELITGETFTKDSPLVQEINERMINARWEIKDFAGFLPHPNADPIKNINGFLKTTIDTRLTARRISVDGQRKWGYCWMGYNDGREAVWERWQIREQEYKESQANEKSGCLEKDYIRSIFIESEQETTRHSDPKSPEITDQPTSVVGVEEEVGVVEVMATEVEGEQQIAPTIQPPTPPQAPQEGWVLAPPDQYWEDVMNYVYQGMNPIKQWVGKLVEVVTQPFQYWVDSPWFVQGILRDGFGNRQEVVLPIALIG